MAKSNISVEIVEDWNNLRYKINKYFSHFPDYIFRGHGQDDWLLESTLSRALKKSKAKNKRELVSEHLKRFKLDIRGRRGDNPRVLSEDEIWAMGQHNGLFTPLLDWSESPWVAIFFALTSVEQSNTGKRALYALHFTDVETINDFYKKKKGGKRNIVELIEPEIDENRRLVNQRGLFTKLDIENDIEKWVTNAQDIGDWLTLYKIIFPDTIRQKAILYLNLMNINHSSLFPDLYGSSINTNMRLLQNDYILERQQLDWDGNLEDEE